ncbi:MAG: substrate-binding domain-containing protein, partial [Pseudomonadota bacterium]
RPGDRRGGMRTCYLILLAVLCASCGPQDDGPPPDPIVVYAPDSQKESLPALFAEFTADTGIHVAAKWGPSAGITDGVINKTGIPADILLTDNVADIWRAADEGALRPIDAESVAKVASSVRDSDGFWVSRNVYAAVLVTQPLEGRNVGERVESIIEQFDFCVLTSHHPLSRSYIVNSIQDLGVKTAERGIRRMVAALEREPYASEEELLDAVRVGECNAAMVANATADSALQVHEVDLGAATIDAVGIGRHARSADSAQRFVAWLISERPVEVPATLTTPVSVAGFRDEEARLLAERAGYH